MKTASWLLLSLIVFSLLGWSPAHTADEPGTGFAIINVTVKYTDGSPGKAMPVSILSKGQEVVLELATDENGHVSTLVPAGEAVVSVAGQTQTIKIVAGEQQTLTFTVKIAGVLVNVKYKDGVILPVSISGAYRAPNKNAEGINPVQMAPGTFLFSDVPDDATRFSCVVRSYSNNVQACIRQISEFTKKEELRTVDIIMARLSPLSIVVLGAENAPLANTAVKGSIRYTSTAPSFWEDGPQDTYQGRMVLDGRKTDGNGVLSFGEWPAVKVEITLRTDTQVGALVTADVQPEGAPTIIKYVLNGQSRDVTQTLFTAEGKPAVNAKVNISYYWQNKLIYTEATADADGKVVWKNLPPVNATVWGPEVPAGVISGDATAVTAPLAAPKLDRNHTNNIKFYLDNVGDQATRVTYAVKRESERGLPGFAGLQYEPAAGKPPTALPEQWVYSGESITVVAVTKTTPPRFGILSNFYVPNTVEPESGELPIKMQVGTALCVKFATKDGPVAGVSKFRVLPVTITSNIFAGISDDLLPGMNLYTPIANADGTYTVNLPGAGTYRLLVDLYDESTPPIPELLVDVPAEGKEATITLPDPLVTVPAGTELQWLTVTTPALPQRLVAPAFSNPMSIFGPRNRILAYWFRPSPDKMQYWNTIDGKTQTLPLCASKITTLYESPFVNTVRLLPLLPTPLDRFPDTYNDSLGPLSYPFNIPEEGVMLKALWAGKYLLTLPDLYAQNDKASYLRLYPLEIPAGNPREITLTIPGRGTPFMQGMRDLQFGYSKDNFEQLRSEGANSVLAVLDEGTRPYSQQWLSCWDLRGNSFSIPATTQKVTFYWIGVGVSDTLSVPADVNTCLDIPSFNPGTIIAGKIIQPNGQPYANKQISIIVNGFDASPAIERKTAAGDLPMKDKPHALVPSLQAMASFTACPYTLRRTTDAQGAFRVNGIIPGTVFIITDSSLEIERGNEHAGNGHCWTFNVPEEGLTDLTLRASVTPVCFNAGINANVVTMSRGQMNTSLWWLPDNGKPVCLPMGSPIVNYQNIPAGSGWLWWVDNYYGQSRYVRTTLTQHYQTVYFTSTGPGLGIYFPLNLACGLPRSVTVIGLDERAGLQARFSAMKWQASTLLNKVVGQIDALPPGKYRVIVETVNGLVESTATVTEYGGKVEMDFPAAPRQPK